MNTDAKRFLELVRMRELLTSQAGDSFLKWAELPADLRESIDKNEEQILEAVAAGVVGRLSPQQRSELHRPLERAARELGNAEVCDTITVAIRNAIHPPRVHEAGRQVG